MLKTTNKKGFTIIEVVITIAIGAAVMALVLNAVAGARRSQRNNARVSDVNQVSSAIGQFIASRNQLPDNLNDIATILENGSSFGHYGGITCTTATPPVCTSDSIQADNTLTTATPANGAIPVGPTTNYAGGQFDEDEVLILRQAQCETNDTEVGDGGLRDMAVMYKLEGQTAAICLDI